jgi:hypothetical protein
MTRNGFTPCWGISSGKLRGSRRLLQHGSHRPAHGFPLEREGRAHADPAARWNAEPGERDQRPRRHRGHQYRGARLAHARRGLVARRHRHRHRQPGGNTQGVAINRRGEVAGFGGPCPTCQPQAFYWSRETGIVVLGTFGGFRGFVFGIDHDGRVAGWYETPDQVGHAFLWTRQGGKGRSPGPGRAQHGVGRHPRTRPGHRPCRGRLRNVARGDLGARQVVTPTRAPVAPTHTPAGEAPHRRLPCSIPRLRSPNAKGPIAPRPLDPAPSDRQAAAP